MTWLISQLRWAKRRSAHSFADDRVWLRNNALASVRPIDLNRSAAVDSAAGLFSRSFASAVTEGTDVLSLDLLSMIGRAFQFKGECVGALTAEGQVAPSFLMEVLGRQP